MPDRENDDSEAPEEPWNDPRLDPRQRAILEFFAMERGTRVTAIEKVTKTWEQFVKSVNRKPELMKMREEFNLEEKDIFLNVAPKDAAARTDGIFESEFGGNKVRCGDALPRTASFIILLRLPLSSQVLVHSSP